MSSISKTLELSKKGGIQEMADLKGGGMGVQREVRSRDVVSGGHSINLFPKLWLPHFLVFQHCRQKNIL